MSNNVPPNLVSVLLAQLGRLRFKNLFLFAAGLLLVDLVIPDFIPFFDELLLGVLTMMFWLWRKPPIDPEQARVIDVDKDPG
jgi:hypothetical protein